MFNALDKENDLEGRLINGRLHLLMNDYYVRIPVAASDVIDLGDPIPKKIPKIVVEEAEKAGIEVSKEGALTTKYVLQIQNALLMGGLFVVAADFEKPKNEDEQLELEIDEDLER
jgi:hypothetical protein